MQSELNDWMAHPPDGCLLDTFDPLLNWTIQMQGPETAPAPGFPRLYENEVFRLAVNFTDRYPMEPPGKALVYGIWLPPCVRPEPEKQHARQEQGSPPCCLVW